MKYHETRRKIIRKWIALPKDKRQTEEQVAAFAKKAAQHRRAQTSRDSFEPECAPSQAVRTILSAMIRHSRKEDGCAATTSWSSRPRRNPVR